MKYAFPTKGFGAPLTSKLHHFILTINDDMVILTEDLGQDNEAKIFRASIPRQKWDVISNVAKRVLNRGLSRYKLKPGKWQDGNNPIDRLLGKELCVLLWALEGDANPSSIAKNWEDLPSESRWWLFGLASEKRSWRVALRYGLKDTF